MAIRLSHRPPPSSRARQSLRASPTALRDERPTSTVFGRPDPRPRSAAAKVDAAELVRVATALIAPGQTSLFAAWRITDADLALMRMRPVANGDPGPQVTGYARAHWDRRSARRTVAHRPATP